jgi:hypothetical protein
MTDRERLRLFCSLLLEGVAVALSEGGDTKKVREWSVRADRACADYKQSVEERQRAEAVTPGPVAS